MFRTLLAHHHGRIPILGIVGLAGLFFSLADRCFPVHDTTTTVTTAEATNEMDAGTVRPSDGFLEAAIHDLSTV